MRVVGVPERDGRGGTEGKEPGGGIEVSCGERKRGARAKRAVSGIHVSSISG